MRPAQSRATLSQYYDNCANRLLFIFIETVPPVTKLIRKFNLIFQIMNIAWNAY
jgi:hypothetical protein